MVRIQSKRTSKEEDGKATDYWKALRFVSAIHLQAEAGREWESEHKDSTLLEHTTKKKCIDFKVSRYFAEGTKNVPEQVFTGNSNKAGPYWEIQKAHQLSDDKSHQLETSIEL